MNRYAWIIDKDHYDGAAELLDRLRAGEGKHFRLKDDDGELYYEGRIILANDHEGDDEFAPLDEWGKPNAGCTTIEYQNPKTGAWEVL